MYNVNGSHVRTLSCSLNVIAVLLVEVLIYIHRNCRFIRDGSPGRPPCLSHSSWVLLSCSEPPQFVVILFWTSSVCSYPILDLCLYYCYPILNHLCLYYCYPILNHLSLYNFYPILNLLGLMLLLSCSESSSVDGSHLCFFFQARKRVETPTDILWGWVFQMHE